MPQRAQRAADGPTLSHHRPDATLALAWFVRAAAERAR
jgi:hypothetical protein